MFLEKALTVLEMLYNDMKVHRGTHIAVAMSSISTKLEDAMSRPEFADSCATFCSACPVDVLIIMAFCNDAGAAHRGIAVFSWNKIYREQITDVLLSSVSPNLELELMTAYSHLDNVSAFFQHNVQVSQKEAMPLIQEFLAGERNTVDNLAQLYAGSPLGSDFLGEMADVSNEEVRKHINLAKTFQSDQFRTSQDRYDFAAIGTDPVISASLSSDSEFSSSDNRKDGALDNDDTDDNIDDNKVELNENYEFNSGAKMFDDFVVNNTGSAGDGANVDALVEVKEAASSGDSSFVDNLIDFGFDGKDDRNLTAEIVADIGSDFKDLAGGHDFEFVSSIRDAGVDFKLQTIDQASLKPVDVKATDSRDDITGDLFNVNSESVDVDSSTISAKDENTFGDAFLATIDAKDENNFDAAFLDHSPFNLLGPDFVESLVDISDSFELQKDFYLNLNENMPALRKPQGNVKKNQPVPANQPVPGNQLVPINQPVPGNQLVPINQPVPGNQLVPINQPVPGNQLVPINQPVPGNQLVPINQPVPGNQLVPINQPVPGNQLVLANQPVIQPIVNNNYFYNYQVFQAPQNAQGSATTEFWTWQKICSAILCVLIGVGLDHLIASVDVMTLSCILACLLFSFSVVYFFHFRH